MDDIHRVFFLWTQCTGKLMLYILLFPEFGVSKNCQQKKPCTVCAFDKETFLWLFKVKLFIFFLPPDIRELLL